MKRKKRHQQHVMRFAGYEHPQPAAWVEKPIRITETLAEFLARKDEPDLFDSRRNPVEWELLWIENQLRANGKLRAKCWDAGDRFHNAEKIWEFGKEHAWANLVNGGYDLLGIFTAILHFVGLTYYDPKLFDLTKRAEANG